MMEPKGGNRFLLDQEYERKKKDFSFFTHYRDLPLTGTAGTAKVTDHETDHETSSETGRQDEH